MSIEVPSVVPNWIGGVQSPALSGASLAKLSPHSGAELWRAARSGSADVSAAFCAAVSAQPAWAALPPVRRGELLRDLAQLLREHAEDLAAVVARETGKSPAEALGETLGAASLGFFFAGEGQRLYGRTTTSAIANKTAMTVRRPLGVAGLVIAANTPMANAAWKVFPALICGNAAVLKAAEDTPATAWALGLLARRAGIPDGVLNIVQGFGEEAGWPLVNDPRAAVVSFTGSSAVGRRIAVACGGRLARVSLELGGKNPLVVCDDADLDQAVRWAALSAFSNAGQRCASGSRLIVFESVYVDFKARLLDAVDRFKVGPDNGCDLGPVINQRQLENMLGAVDRAKAAGARVLAGGFRLSGPEHAAGFYMAPTVLENADPLAEISVSEVFGPVTCLYPARDFGHAVALANDSPYGLSACIHTRSLHRAVLFAERVQAGVVMVNAGTYGSEPHMPFGGVKASGNGTREPGTEALDIYSSLQDVCMLIDPDRV